MIGVIKGDARSLDPKPYMIGVIKGVTRSLDPKPELRLQFLLFFFACFGPGASKLETQRNISAAEGFREFRV